MMNEVLLAVFSSGNVAAGVSIAMAVLFLRYVVHRDRESVETTRAFLSQMATAQDKYQEQMDGVAEEFTAEIRRVHEGLVRIEAMVNTCPQGFRSSINPPK